MDISISYYEDMSRISNSNVGWYMKRGPMYLRNMLDGKEEGLSAKFLEKGTMIHMYLLQPDEFWKNYIILDFTVPKSKQQKDALDYYSKAIIRDPFGSQDELKLEAYKSAYNNSKSNDKCLEEMNGFIDAYQEYLKYLTETENNKAVISFSDLNMLKTIKSNIENHKMASILLTDTNTCECHNEFHINWEVDKEDIKVQCKSLLDRVIFDHENKVVTLIDLKTTLNVYDFAHSVEEFDYYRQVAYYLLALTWYMINVLKVNPDEYDFKAYIIAIQNNGSFEVRVFDMNDEQKLLERKNIISEVLQRISYHQQTGDWEHTPDYYKNDGIESLYDIGLSYSSATR